MSLDLPLDEALYEAAPPRDTLDLRRAKRSLERRIFGGSMAPMALGRYIILGRIGSGGSGLVFSAYDPELNRKVALKVLRASPYGESAYAEPENLLREARAMASLSHPNVVPVYDVGTYGHDDVGAGDTSELDVPSQGVFVVMEFVEGQTVHDWLRRERPAPNEILQVFVSAGRGLAAAHDAGLIHGDVKPSNFHIAADGQVRVLDFGLAAWIDAPRVEADGVLVGTPRYLAPERTNGAPPSARSDQFSFCVALSEALFGEPTGGERSGVPRRAALAVDRGLSEDPAARFDSMSALLDRLAPRPRRWLPVAVGTLLLGASAGVWALSDAPCDEQADAAADAVWNDEARAAGAAAFAASDRPFSADAWAAIQTDLSRHTEAWKRLRVETCRARSQINVRTVCLDRWLVRLENVVTTLSQANARLVELGPDAVAKLSPEDLCAHTDAEVAVSAQGREAALAVEGSLAQASILRTSGRIDEASTEVDRALARAQLTNDPATVARALAGRANHYGLVGAEAQSEADYVAALYAAEQADDQEFALRMMIAIAGSVSTHGGRPQEALRLLAHAEARGIDEVALPRLAYSLMFTRGRVYEAQGRPAEALRTFEQALAMLDAETTPPVRMANLLNNIGVAHDRLGDKRKALEHYLRALELRRVTSGEAHPHYANALGNVGITRASLGDEAEAIDDLTRAVEIYDGALGEDVGTNRHAAWVIANLGHVLIDRGRSEEGLVQMQRAHAIRLRALPQGHPHLPLSYNGLARALAAVGRSEEALPEIERGVELFREKDNALRLVAALNDRATILNDVGRFAEALAVAREATGLADERLGRDHPRGGDAREQWGRALALRGAPADAAPLFEDALAIWTAAGNSGPSTARARFALAKALRGSEPQRALALAQEARDAVAPIAHRAAETGEMAAFVAQLIGQRDGG